MLNGDGWVIKLLISGGIGAVVAVTSFNGTKIDRNKDTNETQHIEIRKDMVASDKVITDSLHKFDVRQEVLIETVKSIDEKIKP